MSCSLTCNIAYCCLIHWQDSCLYRHGLAKSVDKSFGTLEGSAIWQQKWDGDHCNYKTEKNINKWAVQEIKVSVHECVHGFEDHSWQFCCSRYCWHLHPFCYVQHPATRLLMYSKESDIKMSYYCFYNFHDAVIYLTPYESYHCIRSSFSVLVLVPNLTLIPGLWSDRY